MKSLEILFIPLFIFSIGICQAHPKATKKNNDNIASHYNLMSGADIKAMVQIQIDSAKARDSRGEIKSCMYYDNSSQDAISLNNENAGLETRPTIEINPKVLVLTVFSIFVFLFVLIKRFIKNRNFSSGLAEPEIIEITKKEGTINDETADLEQIRDKLNPSIPDIKESSFPGKTTGMKIAQGEMILAAKIKSYQLAHFGNK